MSVDVRYLTKILEDDLLGAGHSVADIAGEGARDQRILVSPDEQRGRLELAEPGVEALRALGLLEVDVPRRRMKCDPGADRAVGAEELLHSDIGGGGVDALRTGEHAPELLADDGVPEGVRNRGELR